MSKPPRLRRSVHGILLLDKPKGVTSNAALQMTKRLYAADKAGHTGSLDPMATGMLPICFGEATKVSGHLLDAPKAYRFRAQLGAQTNTGDADGQIIAEFPIPALTREGLLATLQSFTGVIQQTPPMYSALHHEGQRLYVLARAGVTVERELREVRIERLELVAFGPDWIEADVACSKGTYIRTLAEDIAKAMGTGAHLVALRRQSVAGFNVAAMIDFDRLEALKTQGDFAALDEALLPIQSALASWPSVCLDASQARSFCHGQTINSVPTSDLGWVALYDEASRLLGLGEVVAGGQIAPRRIINS